MAELVIDLSGRAGLGSKFFGDTDMLVPQPNYRLATGEGTLAQGLFNPYLREGYMAPAFNDSRAVTLDTTAGGQLSSMVFDPLYSRSYWADGETKIYEKDSIDSLDMETVITLATGSEIQDLEIALIGNTRSLLYTYTDTNALLKSTTSIVSEWLSVGFRLIPNQSTPPIITSSVERYSNETTQTDSITVPAGSNRCGIVVVSTPGGTTSGVTYNGVSMTKAYTATNFAGGAEYETTVWYVNSVATGANSVVVSKTTTGIGFTHIMSTTNNLNSSVPIDNFDVRVGNSSTAVNLVESDDDSSYFQYVLALPTNNTLSGATADGSYNPAAQTDGTGTAFDISDDGTKMYVAGDNTAVNNAHVYQYTLSTAWDVTTASYATKSLNAITQIGDFTPSAVQLSAGGLYLFIAGPIDQDDIDKYDLGTPYDLATASASQSVQLPEGQIRGFTFNSDGTTLYVKFSDTGERPFTFIKQYSLATPYSLTTMTDTDLRFDIPADIGTPTPCLALSGSDTMITIVDSDENSHRFSFNPLFPGDISKITRDTDTFSFPVGNSNYIKIKPGGGVVYARSGADDIYQYNLTEGNDPSISTEQTVVEGINSNAGAALSSYVTLKPSLLQCGVAPLPFTTEYDDDWLTDRAGLTQSSFSDYNFIRNADNGFSYLFAGNKVHKIDGGITGGENGVVTPSVLVFPNNFTILDAIDYRSRMYIALHQSDVSSRTPDRRIFSGKCGIFVWNRLSIQLTASDYIELPGVKQIRKIYASPDGVLKAIVISDSGLTELRQFGYNDSGGVVFRTIKEMGIGAFPLSVDGLTTAGDKSLWLANDGRVYCEKGGVVTQIFQAKAAGDETTEVLTNISSGAILLAHDDSTADSGFRQTRQSFLFSYLDGSTVTNIKINPFDAEDELAGAQTLSQSDVYTEVYIMPVTSVLRNVRIYNFPVVSTNTNTCATVKLYFNQKTTATFPTGMTKTITNKEASRGYVDFKINAPYVHALQIEIEWPSSETFSANDTYLPSVAVVTYDITETQSPDNG